MKNPDQLHELFRMQQALNARIGVKTDGMTEEANFQRQESSHTTKDENDSKHI